MRVRLMSRHLAGLVVVLVVFLLYWTRSGSSQEGFSREEHSLRITGTSRELLRKDQNISRHSDIEVRGKWQQKQIINFCSHHGLANVAYSLDLEQPLKNEFFRHIIVDDKSKNLYCFMPKVGCTTARSTLLVATGILPRSILNLIGRKHSLEKKLEGGLKRSSFLDHSLNDTSRISRMQTYGKYTIVRHPLQRLLSAYLDKLSGLLSRHNQPYNYFEHLKHVILKDQLPALYSTWTERNDMTLNVSFIQYIKWLIGQSLTTLNEHFAPQFYNSQPCRMHYHFYGNFDQFEKDFSMILEKFQIGGSLFLDRFQVRQGERMVQRMDLYFSKLTRELKHSLFKKFSLEFDFYHHLYPLEIPVTEKCLDL